VIQSSVVATLGQAVGDAEAALFVGRRREMARFAEWVGRLRTQPGALYVHGPAGTGKSALLRAMAHWADHHEVPSLLLDLEGLTGATGSDLVLALGRHLLGRDAAAVDRGGEAVAAALQRLGGASRCFLLLVDGYDTLGAEEQPFREQVLGRLGPGVGVVLAGRVSVTRLWADAPAWRATVPEVTLPPLEPAEAQHLLDRLAVTDPRLRVPVLDLADGHPRLLVRSAAALRADAAWAAPTAAADAPRFRLFLLERMLHPRSLRKAWRAGGSDEVIAAASLLPRFDRLTLTAALGRSAVDRAWPTLLELAGVSEEGGRYALPPGLRLHLAGAVVAQRPWAEARWRRLMLAHLSARCQAPLPGADPGEDWIAVAALAREARWHAPLHPPAEARDGWRVGCAITVSRARTVGLADRDGGRRRPPVGGGARHRVGR